MVASVGVTLDDLLYGGLLVSCILFGWCFRRIKNPVKKKWISTTLGFLLVLAVSGSHVLRPLIVTTVNAFLITICGKRYSHIFSFIFTFGFLTFFRVSDYFGAPFAPGPVNLINMVLTMRMVGLAFESRDSWLAHKTESKMATSGAKLSEMEEKEPMDVHPGFLDVYHYAFCYVGVLTGPYFRYNTYRDMINTPFAKYAPCWDATVSRLLLLPFTVIAFVIVNGIYPNKMALTDEFYTNHSVMYRIIFLSISFFNFRMRIYTGVMLSECVCTMAGLGAYPDWCKPKYGMGPTCRWQEVARLGRSPVQAMREKYNFETIRSVIISKCEFEPTVRQCMKSWNMTIQYWLAAYVYKRFPIKSFRTTATMFMSAFWHGAHAGYYLCIMSVAPHLVVEDLYVKLFLNDAGPKLRHFMNFMIWFMRLQGFGYMSITFQLLSIDAALRYWGSIYYCYHWVLGSLYVAGLVVQFRRPKRPTPAVSVQHNFHAIDPPKLSKTE